jgi:hypothetical protein
MSQQLMAMQHRQQQKQQAYLQALPQQHSRPATQTIATARDRPLQQLYQTAACLKAARW